MALIECPECATRVSERAVSCPSCGCPIVTPESMPPLSTVAMQSGTVSIAKSRGVYIILGILFGAWGFHNFYAGHYVSGAIKLGLFFFALILDASTRFVTGFSLVAIVICEIWAILEIIVVTEDGKGHAMT